MRTLTTAAATAATLVALMAGCGDDAEVPVSDDDRTSSESGDGSVSQADDDPGSAGGYLPCADVWVDGKTLPDDYGGCADEGSIAGSSWQDCADGSKLFTHDSSFFTEVDGTIVATKPDELLDDPAFEKRSADC